MNPKTRLSLTAMAGFTSKTTGIQGVVVWLNPGEGGAHGPMVKVSNVKGKTRFEAKDCFSVSIPRNPQHSPTIVAGECELTAKELKRVISFIANNIDQLLQIWRAEALPDELTFTKVGS